MGSAALMRYNFRVLMYRSWWLLVFPIAASQFTIFWNLITLRNFTAIPAQQVELVSPLLAAFLSAHLLTAEYQSRIGSILASKPLDIGRVVLMRLVVAMGIVWGLGLLSLFAYFFWQAHFDLLPTAFAGMVSCLFLGLFALTFATLFRNPLAGFGIAALYWALDLPPGPPIHPFLSLRSLNTSLFAPNAGVNLITDKWWIAKIVLLAGALALYVIHARLIFTLGSPLTQRVRRRTIAWAVAIIGIYLVTGAMVKVAYGYSNRGHLPPDDASWFRQQFAPFGPIPVTVFFGPAFQRYVGDVPNSWRLQQEGETDRWGDTSQHHFGLREVVEKMPGSIWAPSASELFARLEVRREREPAAKVALYQRILDRYGNSPYNIEAQREIARIYMDAGMADKARAGYEALLTMDNGGPYRAEALKYLVASDRERKDLASAEKRAREWISLAPIHEKFSALIALAEIQRDQGNKAAAKDSADKAAAAARAYKRADVAGQIEGTAGQKVKWNREAIETEDKARAY